MNESEALDYANKYRLSDIDGDQYSGMVSGTVDEYRHLVEALEVLEADSFNDTYAEGAINYALDQYSDWAFSILSVIKQNMYGLTQEVDPDKKILLRDISLEYRKLQLLFEILERQGYQELILLLCTLIVHKFGNLLARLTKEDRRKYNAGGLIELGEKAKAALSENNNQS